MTSNDVVALLTHRDELANALGSGVALTSRDVSRLERLDENLRLRAQALHGLLGGSLELDRWRRVLGRDAADWWVASCPHHPPPRPRHFVWNLITGILLLVTVPIALEDAVRLLSAGPDFVSIVLSLAQVVLAFFALLLAAVGTKPHQLVGRAVDGILSWARVRPAHHHIGRTALVAFFLAGAAAILELLPLGAHWYNERAVDSQSVGQLTTAIDAYQHAINLAPDYAQAHYGLGSAYEDVLDFAKAESEYQRAIRADPRFYHAANNLGRLYIADRSDYAGALKILNEAIDQYPTTQIESSVLYSLYKNRAWAFFGLRLIVPATDDLGQALEIRPDGAAAHCLMAQVLEVQGAANDSVIEHWESCLRYAGGDTVEPIWVAMSRERLNRGSLP